MNNLSTNKRTTGFYNLLTTLCACTILAACGGGGGSSSSSSSSSPSPSNVSQHIASFGLSGPYSHFQKFMSTAYDPVTSDLVVGGGFVRRMRDVFAAVG